MHSQNHTKSALSQRPGLNRKTVKLTYVYVCTCIYMERERERETESEREMRMYTDPGLEAPQPNIDSHGIQFAVSRGAWLGAQILPRSWGAFEPGPVCIHIYMCVYIYIWVLTTFHVYAFVYFDISCM